LQYDAAGISTHLDSHQHIALDFDGCLLDGPYSRLLTDYMASRGDKDFSIITNRPGRCKRDTEAVAYGLLLRRNISHDFKFTHIVLSPDADLCGDSINPHFKGKSAAAIGATILVDDDVSHRKGCDIHGVQFLHLPAGSGSQVKVGLF